MEDGEIKPAPSFIIDEDATSAQRLALETFENIAGWFSEAELRAAMAVAERHPEAVDTLLPLTRDPEKTSKLINSWKTIAQTEAHLVADFDSSTEKAIQADPEFDLLKQRRDNAQTGEEQDKARDAMIRFRFVKFGSLLVKNTVQEEVQLRPPA